MIRALIFDFDGLILETEGPVYQSWSELYQEFGYELVFEDWATIIGTSEAETFDPFDELESKLGRKLDRGTIVPERRQRELDLIAQQSVMPGVEEYIRDAQRLGFKLGIASSSSRQWVTGHLTRLSLVDHFEVIHTSDDVVRTKPDPALFNLVLESLRVHPRQAIVLEDSPNGVIAAKRAGIFTVAVPNGITRRLDLDHADLRLESLTDLSLGELIEKVERGGKAL
jgi:HAD superfamily hydrolase (TIGR01509 family)